MKSIGFITVSLIILSVLCGCFETQLTTNYINEEYGIGIDPPSNWIQQEYTNNSWIVQWQPHTNSTTVLLISKPFRLDEGLSLSVFADDIEESYPNNFTNFSTQKREWLTIRGLTAYEIEYTYSENNSVVKEFQIAVKHTRDFYILKFTSQISEYNTFFSDVNDSISTFQVK